MAITLKGVPDKFSAVYNPIYFYPDSTNKTQPGFRYLTTVFSAGTSFQLGQFRIAPRPVDGYGVVDINQILVPYTSYYFNQNMETIIDSFENYVDYDVRFGEEYIYNWDFANNNVVTGGIYSGLTAFVSSGNVHTFTTGDFVTVTQDAGFAFSGYNGTFQVLSANPTTIIVNVVHTSTPVNPGNVTYADLRKVTFSSVTLEQNYSAFNGALGHQQLYDYTGLTYTMATTNPSAKFLTNAPDGYTVRATNGMWLNLHSDILSATTWCELNTAYGQYFLQNFQSGASPTIQTIALGPYSIDNIATTPNQLSANTWNLGAIGTYPVFKNKCWCYDQLLDNNDGTTTLINSNGEVSPWFNNYNDELVDIVYQNNPNGQTFILDTPASNSVMVGISYSALTGFTTGCIKQITEWYTVQMLNTPQTSGTSELRTFNVDWSTTRYGNIELLFIDRLGSFIPANFTLQNLTTINISRNEYQTLLGDLNSSEQRWTFASTSRGKNVLNTTVKKQIELISNWLREEDVTYYQELFTSPVVYIKQNNLYWPVVVRTDSFQVLNKNNRKNLQIRIIVEMAVNDTIQAY